MRQDRPGTLVLGIAPTTRGFGYAVFESIRLPVDWGVKEIRVDKNRQSLTRAAELFDRIKPATLVLEDWWAAGRRSVRVRALLRALGRSACRQGIAVHGYSREAVCSVFATHGARSKDDMAAAIVRQVPELAACLPRRRRLWQSERYGMAVFEAVALVMTHYANGDD